MRKIFVIILIIVLLIPILWIGYNKLPNEITRRKDIKFGNELIVKIQNYQIKYSQLPSTDDWEILEQIGFKTEMLGTDPSYQKISDDEYELIYIEGFDAPYLLYNSKSKKWIVDFPKFPKKENKEKEPNFPWSKNITQVAIQAILNSIENLKQNQNYKGNFPTDINNMPFARQQKADFEIVGYSSSATNPEIYQIDFHPKNEYKSGQRFTVEINIKTEKAIRVYMTPDA
jgi:hypothetical protein